MKIFCRNYICKNIQFLDTPIRFSFRKHYIPLGKDDGYCMAECKLEFPGFRSNDMETKGVKYKTSLCMKGEINSCKKECLWNNQGRCEREEIFIDKFRINDVEFWICKCHSDIKISGHIDFSRFGQKKDMF